MHKTLLNRIIMVSMIITSSRIIVIKDNRVIEKVNSTMIIVALITITTKNMANTIRITMNITIISTNNSSLLKLTLHQPLNKHQMLFSHKRLLTPSTLTTFQEANNNSPHLRITHNLLVLIFESKI